VVEKKNPGGEPDCADVVYSDKGETSGLQRAREKMGSSWGFSPERLRLGEGEGERYV